MPWTPRGDLSCRATIGPTHGSQVEKLFSAVAPWILRWWDLSLGSYPIFSNHKLSHLPWTQKRWIQLRAYVGRSTLSCLATETALDMTSALSASIISDIRTTSIYNPSFVPKGREHHLNIQGKKGKIQIPIPVIPRVQPLLSLAGSLSIPTEVCYCSFLSIFIEANSNVSA